MKWTEGDLEAVLDEMRARRGDTTSVEVKRAAGGLPQLADTLCAFANMPNGGVIVLGVDEASGAFSVTGVRNVAEMEAGLVAVARDVVAPSPQIVTQTLSVGGARVLIAHVVPLRILDKPAVVDGRAYLRQADGDYVMQEHELRMIEVAKLHVQEQVSYDLQVAYGRAAEDLVPDLVNSFVATVRERDGRLRERTDDEILRRTSVLTSAGEPTLAGLYALGDYPQGQYPGLTVTAAVQLPGGEGSPRNRNLRDFTGPVPVLLEDLMQWTRQNVDTLQVYRTDGHMESVPELPLNAVRELISNALVHRDLGPNTLGVGKGIQVRLTPRAFFIQSPGGLRGVALAQLESEEHAQAAVNQRLYQMAKKLTTSDGGSIIEGEGGGIREVFRSTQERGLPRPQLIDTGVQFKALLWRFDERGRGGDEPAKSQTKQDEPPALASASPTRHEPAVLAALREHGPLSLHDLGARTRLTSGQLRYALASPLSDRVVVMVGGQGHKTTRYALAGGKTVSATVSEKDSH